MMSLAKTYHSNNDICWMQNNVLHRDRGPSKITDRGSLLFMHHGAFYRTDGPSMITPNGHVCYADANGNIHRTTGPAVIRVSGKKEYFVHGQPLSQLEYFLRYGAH